MEIDPANTILCLDSDVSVVNDGSSRASSWGDQSSRLNTHVQATAAKRPAIVSGVDGHRALRGDGTEKFLERLNSFVGLSAGSHPSIYVVASFANADDESSILFDFCPDGTAGDGGGAYHTAAGTLQGRFLLAGRAVAAVAEWTEHETPAGIAVIKLRITDAGADSRTELSVNGVVRGTSGAATAGDGLEFDSDDFRVMGLHGGEWLNGDAYLFLAFDRALSAAKESALYTRLDSHYPSIGL